MNNFIIFSLARSGSTALADIINHCVPLSCYYEPFNAKRYDGRYHRIALEQSILRAVSTLRQDTAGFKHIWDQDGWPFPKGHGINNTLLISVPRSRIIFLNRRNVLRRVVSREIALQSGQWCIRSQTEQQLRSSHRFAPFDVASLKARIVDEQNAFESARKIASASGNLSLEIAFETLYSKERSDRERLSDLRRVLDFIEIPKKNIANISLEVLQLFLRSPYEYTSESVYYNIPNLADILLLGNAKDGYLLNT
jgi:hypothetical protein